MDVCMHPTTASVVMKDSRQWQYELNLRTGLVLADRPPKEPTFHLRDNLWTTNPLDYTTLLLFPSPTPTIVERPHPSSWTVYSHQATFSARVGNFFYQHSSWAERPLSIDVLYEEDEWAITSSGWVVRQSSERERLVTHYPHPLHLIKFVASAWGVVFLDEHGEYFLVVDGQLVAFFRPAWNPTDCPTFSERCWVFHSVDHEWLILSANFQSVVTCGKGSKPVLCEAMNQLHISWVDEEGLLQHSVRPPPQSNSPCPSCAPLPVVC